MKKLLVTLGVLTLVFSLVGCDSKKSNEEVKSADSVDSFDEFSSLNDKTIRELADETTSEDTEIVTDDTKFSVTLNSSELVFPATIATLVEAGVMDSVEPKDEVGGTIVLDNKEITTYKSEDGISYIESISTKEPDMEVLGIEVGVSGDDAITIQKKYEKKSTVSDKTSEADTEYVNGFYYGGGYIEYSVDRDTDKVTSLYIWYENK